MSATARTRQCPLHRHPAVIMGGIIGASLAAVALAWILVANRVPSLDNFAVGRDVAAVAGVGLLMFVLFCRFVNSPGCLFFSGVLAWLIFSATYAVLEIPYPSIASRLGAFHLFMLGAVLIGLIAALLWVLHMMFEMRQHPAGTTRRRLP